MFKKLKLANNFFVILLALARHMMTISNFSLTHSVLYSLERVKIHKLFVLLIAVLLNFLFVENFLLHHDTIFNFCCFKSCVCVAGILL